MPFSIKRLAHLNRSSSVQSKDGSTKGSGPGDANPPETAMRDRSHEKSSSKSSKKSSKSSKSSNKGNEPPPTSATSSQQPVPPSFVIRTQSTIPGSAFQPVLPKQQQHQQQQPSAADLSNSIPNSRSLDANEIRRLTSNSQAAASSSSVTNQSNAIGNPYITEQQQQQTLREWNQRQLARESSYEAAAAAADQSRAQASQSGSTKRVHYAPTTANFTRASSLTTQSHPYPADGQTTATSGGGSSRRVLARQTSTTTPTCSVVTSTTLRNGVGVSSVQASTSSNGLHSHQHISPLSLPRGGEEVLINGGGYPQSRSRSSSKNPPGKSDRHQQQSQSYNKPLYTSSSIDVAMTDTTTHNDGSSKPTPRASSDEPSKMPELGSALVYQTQQPQPVSLVFGLFVGVHKHNQNQLIFASIRSRNLVEWIRSRQNSLSHEWATSLKWTALVGWTLILLVFNVTPFLLTCF